MKLPNQCKKLGLSENTIVYSLEETLCALKSIQVVVFKQSHLNIIQKERLNIQHFSQHEILP